MRSHIFGTTRFTDFPNGPVYVCVLQIFENGETVYSSEHSCWEEAKAHAREAIKFLRRQRKAKVMV